MSSNSLRKRVNKKLNKLLSGNSNAILALDPETPVNVLYELAEYKDDVVNLALALNYNTPLDILFNIVSRDPTDLMAIRNIRERSPKLLSLI